MSTVRFIGCLHLGHEGIARYRGWNNSQEHDNHLIRCWNETVHPRDKTFILGDVTMERDEYYYKLDQLNGRKVVVLGNHDRPQDVPELLKYVDGVAGAVDYKGFFLSHAPIHPNEVNFYRGNIHAHIHHENKLEQVEVHDAYNDKGSTISKSLHKYINVDAHLINYTPIAIYDVLQLRTKNEKDLE